MNRACQLPTGNQGKENSCWYRCLWAAAAAVSLLGPRFPSCRCTCTTCRAAVWSRTHTSRGQARVMAPRGTGLLLRLTRRARAAPGSSRVGSAARVRARSRTAPHGTARVAHPPPPPLCAVGADTDKAGTAWARGHTSPARRTGAIRAVRFFPKKKN